MAAATVQQNHPGSAVIPDRLYFRIGDVASICGVAPSVLRFWETQFPQLKPNKSGTGQRLYRKRDVETALAIKRLVHEEGFTLAGARQALAAQPLKKGPAPKTEPHRQGSLPAQKPQTGTAALDEIRNELRQMLMQLSRPVMTAEAQTMPEPKSQSGKGRMIALQAREDGAQLALFAV